MVKINLFADQTQWDLDDPDYWVYNVPGRTGAYAAGAVEERLHNGMGIVTRYLKKGDRRLIQQIKYPKQHVSNGVSFEQAVRNIANHPYLKYCVKNVNDVEGRVYHNGGGQTNNHKVSYMGFKDLMRSGGSISKVAGEKIDTEDMPTMKKGSNFLSQFANPIFQSLIGEDILGTLISEALFQMEDPAAGLGAALGIGLVSYAGGRALTKSGSPYVYAAGKSVIGIGKQILFGHFLRYLWRTYLFGAGTGGLPGISLPFSIPRIELGGSLESLKLKALDIKDRVTDFFSNRMGTSALAKKARTTSDVLSKGGALQTRKIRTTFDVL